MKQKIKQMLIKFLGIDELERLVETNDRLNLSNINFEVEEE